MSNEKMITAVKATLNKKPMSARDVMRALKEDGSMDTDDKKKMVNSALYSLLKSGDAEKTDSTPPLWTKVRKGKASKSEDDDEEEKPKFEKKYTKLIFIEVTNDDDELHAAASTYAGRRVRVMSYKSEGTHADMEETKWAEVIDVPKEVSVPMKMMYDIGVHSAQLFQLYKKVNYIAIVSKSELFKGAPGIVADEGLEVDLITDGWEGLKLILE